MTLTAAQKKRKGKGKANGKGKQPQRNFQQTANQGVMQVVPYAVSKSVTKGMPNIKATRDGIRVVFREPFIGIAGSTTTAIQQFFLNPGNPTLFTWLSAIARCYESYKFHRFEAEYIPACAADEKGQIGLAVDFDPNTNTDPKPGTLQELLTNKGAICSAVRSIAKYVAPAIELAGHMQKLYVSPESQTSSSNWSGGLRHVGRFMTAVNETTDQATKGRIWLSYDVSLKTPSVPAPIVTHFQGSQDTPNNTTWMSGTSSTRWHEIIKSAVDLVWTTGAVTLFFRNASKYLVEISGSVNTANFAVIPVLTAVAGCVSTLIRASPTGGTNAIALYELEATDPKATATIDRTGLKSAAGIQDELRIDVFPYLRSHYAIGTSFDQLDTTGTP